jgi:fatty acyl-CoA reductase
MSIPISEFYKEKSVLITGPTGFVGKLLIEKLLYSCENLSKIYCLIREKNGRSAHERLNEIISCKVFDKLRKKEPCFRDRLVAINGNILETNLDLTSNENFENLKNEVNVVFHLAGTVDLDLDLKYTKNLFSFFFLFTESYTLNRKNFTADQCVRIKKSN